MARLDVDANVFPLMVDISLVHQYDVKIEPRPPGPRVLQRLFSIIRKRLEELIGVESIFTGQTLYALKGVPNIEPFEVVLRSGRRKPAAGTAPAAGSALAAAGAADPVAGAADPVAEDAGQKYLLVVSHVGAFDPKREDATMFLNLLLERKVFGGELHLKSLGRALVDPKLAHNYDKHALTVWPGVESVVERFGDKLGLRLDIVHKVVRHESVLDMYRSLQQGSPQSTAGQHAEFESQIMRRVVVTRYNDRTYRVIGVAWDLSPRSEFVLREHLKPGERMSSDDAAAAAGEVGRRRGPGRHISFMEYFETHYNIKIRTEVQPLLVAEERRGKRPVKLVPELCYMTGISDQMRSGNIALMREMATVMSKAPSVRLNEVVKWAQKVATSKALGAWHVAVNPTAVRVSAVRLPPVLFVMRKGGQPTTVDVASHRREVNFANLQVIDPTYFKLPPGAQFGWVDWDVVYGARDDSAVRNFIDRLKRLASAMGIQVQDPNFVSLPQLSARDVESYCRRDATPGRFSLFVLGPDKMKNGYSQLKKILLTETNVTSQVVLSKTLSNSDDTVPSKIALQIHAKMGMPSYFVEPPPSFIKEPTMVVGLNLEPINAATGSGVVALTATFTQQFHQLVSYISYHPTQREVGQVIAEMVRKAVDHFRLVNGITPFNILIYRSGVSEGQLRHINERELGPARELLAQLAQPPKITLLVVQKKVSTKFCSTRSGGDSNAPPGTAVSQSPINTAGEFPDFYLISQTTKPGSTASPTRYVSVAHEMPIGVGDLQTFTNQQCNMYSNFAAGVAVPAAVKYANRLCEMTTKHLMKSWRPSKDGKEIPVPIPDSNALGAHKLYYI